MKKAIAAGVNFNEDQILFLEEIEELKTIALIFQIEVTDTLIQKRGEINPKSYLSKNKIDELKLILDKTQADILLCNDELTSVQEIYLQSELNVRVLDRSYLLINILRSEARKKEAKLETQLAYLKYNLPRLKTIKYQIAFKKIKSDSLPFKSDKQLESDRRAIMGRITFLEHKLLELKAKKERRKKAKMKSVVLIGYINSGKTSILKAISVKAKSVKDAPLKLLRIFGSKRDVKKISLTKNTECLIADSPSFLNKLPENLENAFKACLKENLNADLILSIVDAANPDYLNKIAKADSYIKKAGVNPDSVIYVFNKTDLLKEYFYIPLPYVKSLKVSSVTGENINKLLETIAKQLFPKIVTETFAIPKNKAKILNLLNDNGIVLNVKNLDLVYLKVCLEKKLAKSLKKYEIK